MKVRRGLYDGLAREGEVKRGTLTLAFALALALAQSILSHEARRAESGSDEADAR